MKLPASRLSAGLLAAVLLLPGGGSWAGVEVSSGSDKKMIAPLEKPVQLGMATLGGEVSSGFGTVYLDTTLPVWNPGNLYLFLDTRSVLDTNTEYLASSGIGVRYLVPDAEVIVGGNIFYDAIQSRFGSDFDQLGLGFEILTKWVDARFNYYLPEGTTHEIGRRNEYEQERDVSRPLLFRDGANRYVVRSQETNTERRQTTRRSESAIGGWNAEIGFLVPGLDKYMETRLFVGAYSYDDQFGRDWTGFKARAEIRPVPGVIANVQYWDDASLMGGHWTGELAVTVPFSLYNLAKGRNPFEGFGEQFRPRQREFSERLGDMIIRSHRTMTSTNDSTETVTNSTTTTTSESFSRPPVLPPQAAGPFIPQVGLGNGGT